MARRRGLMGAAPTGKRATRDAVTIVRLECGEIVEVWSEMDALGLRVQLGLEALGRGNGAAPLRFAR